MEIYQNNFILLGGLDMEEWDDKCVWVLSSSASFSSAGRTLSSHNATVIFPVILNSSHYTLHDNMRHIKLDQLIYNISYAL